MSRSVNLIPYELYGSKCDEKGFIKINFLSYSKCGYVIFLLYMYSLYIPLYILPCIRVIFMISIHTTTCVAVCVCAYAYACVHACMHVCVCVWMSGP